MKPAGTCDSFTAINGPEDGTEFAIAQREVIIGNDSVCAVNVRLDSSVQNSHARATATSDGYRIRSIAGHAVYVNGKRASVVRSRVARNGDILRVGNTDLVLECSVDGIASRSRGMKLEHDITWAVRRAGYWAYRSASGLGAFARGQARIFLRQWKITVLTTAILAYWLSPSVRQVVANIFSLIRSNL